MIRIIFDTSFIVGFIDKSDVWHLKASLINDRLLEIDCVPIVFDCVICETISVLVKRQKEKKKESLTASLIDNLFRFIPKTNITWIYPDIRDFFEHALEMITKSNSIFNFNDALIIQSAKYFGITHIISFDKGFDETGLIRIKDAEDI